MLSTIRRLLELHAGLIYHRNPLARLRAGIAHGLADGTLDSLEDGNQHPIKPGDVILSVIVWNLADNPLLPSQDDISNYVITGPGLIYVPGGDISGLTFFIMWQAEP